VQPRIVLVASVAAIAGAVLVWLAAPDTDVEPAAVPPPAPRAAEVASAPLPSTATEPPRPNPAATRPAVEDDEPVVGKPVERVIEPNGPDRNVVQPATPAGLIMAATARRAELLDCWDDFHENAAEEPPSAFSIDLVLREDERGGQTLRIGVPEVHDDELEACLDEAFADARFQPLDQPALRLVWRVPTP